MSDAWAYQLSVKVEGQHLLNLRADDAVGFGDALKWAAENREAILAACAALEGAQSQQATAPVSPQRQAPASRPASTSGETGPIYIEKVAIMRGPTNKPWKNPLYVVNWEGSSAATFDALIGKAAMGFWQDGNACFVSMSPSPKGDGRFNLDSIRSAAS